MTNKQSLLVDDIPPCSTVTNVEIEGRYAGTLACPLAPGHVVHRLEFLCKEKRDVRRHSIIVPRRSAPPEMIFGNVYRIRVDVVIGTEPNHKSLIYRPEVAPVLVPETVKHR